MLPRNPVGQITKTVPFGTGCTDVGNSLSVGFDGSKTGS